MSLIRMILGCLGIAALVTFLFLLSGSSSPREPQIETLRLIFTDMVAYAWLVASFMHAGSLIFDRGAPQRVSAILALLLFASFGALVLTDGYEPEIGVVSEEMQIGIYTMLGILLFQLLDLLLPPWSRRKRVFDDYEEESPELLG